MGMIAERPNLVYGFDMLVVGLHLRWDGVFQRPQQLLSRIARHVPVLIVEEPKISSRNLDEWIVDDNVTVLRPHRREPQADVLDGRTLAAVRERTAAARPLIWLYTPMMIGLADALSDAPVVVDVMDDLTLFAHADRRLAAREAQALERAAVVFCGGPSLYRSRADRATNVKLYSSGVDVDFFAQARQIQPHQALGDLKGPVFGYIGVIDERIDLELIAAIADAHPEATVAMIGPTAKIPLASLPQRSNIVYYGQRPYVELPAFLAGIDVALMPFALNESTRNISPTKTLEYLAAGRPIVSTPVPDVVSEYAEIVTIAHDHHAFIAALSTAPALALQRRKQAQERAAAASWDAIAVSMLQDLKRAGISPATVGPT